MNQAISTLPYLEDWTLVKQDESSGLPKSALEKVTAIYEKSKKENNPSQIIKSIIYKVKYIGQVEEDAFAKALDSLHKEKESATGLTKPILASILSEIYWQYYENNRYTFLNRTDTENFKNGDIRTYSLHKIVEECIRYHIEALENPKLLQSVPIDSYESILNYDYGYSYKPDGRIFRPTLYDFIAHRAVDFFANTEHGLARPNEVFSVENPAYFGEASKFANIELKTKDTKSFQFYALQILKDLTAFHLKDKDLSTLIDLELKRINFVYKVYRGEYKEKLYLAALKNIEKSYPDLPIVGMANYYIALFYSTRAATYNPLQSDSYKWDYKLAIDICDSVIKKYQNTVGANNCFGLKETIGNKTLALKVEEVNLPNKPFRAFVEYRNTNRLHFAIHKVTKKEMEKLKEEYAKYYEKHKTYIYYEELLINHFAPKKPFEQFITLLPDDKDFQRHSTEVKIPELPLGQYIILAGTSEKISYEKNAVSFGFTNISNLAYMHNVLPSNEIEFFITDRHTGKVLSDVEFTLYEQTYSSWKSKYVISKYKNYVTDKAGYIKVPAPKDYKYFFVELKKGEDVLEPINNYYDSGEYTQTPFTQYPKPDRYNNTPTQITLFTDRAIYRPGQTIYFKGIVLKMDGKKTSIQKNFPVDVDFFNVNNQKVADLRLTSNEYGTFSGSFTAPSNTLNGQMYIYTSYGSKYFSVEEYKRPKFYVEYEPVKGSYKLNDKIKVKGLAKAYSGAVIDGAEVKYRVVRNARFPYWWFCYYGYYPNSPSMEISNGVGKTNTLGEFEVEVNLVPDKNVDSKSMPTFTYEVFADVIDINGETRSGSTRVYAGYQSIVLGINLPENIEKDTNESFDLITNNLAGQFEPVKTTVTIHKLKSPDRVFRERNWTKPDKQMVPKEEYYKNFPEDMYEDELNYFNWQKEKEVLKKNIDTDKEKKLSLDGSIKWDAGKYVAEIKAKDKYNTEAKELVYFSLVDTLAIAANSPEILDVVPETKSLEPGDVSKFTISSKESVHVYYEYLQGEKKYSGEWVELNNTSKKLEIPIKEEYRGNITVNFTTIKWNRFITKVYNINVPYTNKELSISYESFRNKLMPGEQEEWRLKITGSKKEKVAAEMLATLYDSSLDTFRTNSFDFSIYPSYYAGTRWGTYGGIFSTTDFRLYQKDWNAYGGTYYYTYDRLNWFDLYLYNYSGYYPGRGHNRYYEGASGISDGDSYDMDDMVQQPVKSSTGGMRKEKSMAKKSRAMDKSDMKVAEAEEAAPAPAAALAEPAPGDTGLASNTSGAKPDLAGVKARTNFNETAFFMPHLETDKDGNIYVKFTIPEALTKWKMLGFAHTKDLKFGIFQNELVTQKDIMVVPNPPRFFRENDSMEFSSKVSNVSKEDLSGSIQLELFDGLNAKPLSIIQSKKVQDFKVKAGQSIVANWEFKIPEGIQAITYKVVASTGNFSDGEEMTLPVMTNSMLVTESMPLFTRGKVPKTFTMDKLVNSNTSTTLRHQNLTLEYTSNPAWYAVQSLPYLMEYPYECAEQTFSRFYANSLASHIANSSPKIKEVFETWKNLQPNALLSNLEKNQELKSLLLEETPWVLDAKDESARKRRIGLLFDLNRMSNELGGALRKLQKIQSSNGGFPWFQGMKEDRYITQHIATGMGHLLKLGVSSIKDNYETWNMVTKAVQYLDWKIKEDYDYLLKMEALEKWDLSKQNISYLHIQYLYMRSLFKEVNIHPNTVEAIEYYKWQAKTYWKEYLWNKMSIGMIALSLHRMGEETNVKVIPALEKHKLSNFKSEDVPNKIVKSLKEHSLNSEELGMYWKVTAGYYWYELPVETQSLMIEVFAEVAKDEESVESMKVWLIKNKQTNDWKTTKATTEAIYALLLQGKDWLQTEPTIELQLGSKTIKPGKDFQTEAGTGYFKLSYNAADITPDMGKITIKPLEKNAGVSWGGLYWQYFEQLDKITGHETPLKLKKQLFLQKVTSEGLKITPIVEKASLKKGDLLKVRIELEVDREMEYVHMKDMRASALEPTNVISQYKWQDGLGYYETTKDASTNFFFSYLPKGKYVFEYPLRVTHNGDYSNGITTIQCMYAPEFTSHSEGVRIKVGD